MTKYLSYSLIMAVKNGMDYMNAAIESVYSQTLKPSEILFIDDHSTDMTKETVAREYPDIIVLDNVGQGQLEALNLGINNASCEIVSFLDHDDLWTDDKQEIQVNILTNNADLDAITSGVINFNEHGQARDLGPARVFGATSFRRDAFTKFGLLDTSISHHGIIDWWIRAEVGGINHSTHSKVGLMRRLHDSNSGVVSRLESRTDLFSILRKQISKGYQSEI